MVKLSSVTLPPMRPFWLTRTFWMIALGLFIDAYVYGVAAVSISWVPHTPGISTLLLVWAPATLAIGIALGGWLADLVGRRILLQAAPLGSFAGGLILFVGSGLYPALVSSFLLLMTAGIESASILAYSQELVPETTRHTALTAELGFVNLGGVSLAALAYTGGYLGARALRDFIALVPLVLALFSLALRRRLPESRLWQKRRRSAALPPDYLVRFSVAAVFSIANTAGFSLLAFAFGAEFLPSHFHHMLLISTTTAFLVGLGARRLVQLPPKRTLLATYGLALATSLALFWVRRPSHPGFWPILFVLSGLSSISYITEDTMTAKNWPSSIRARALAGTRVVGLAGYSVILLLVNGGGLNRFLAAMAAVWASGLGAAILWRLVGHTRSRPGC